MQNEPFILKTRTPEITGRVEITRSFSYKLNVGNYESRDFFASQRVECDAVDAVAIGEKVYQFCKHQVMQSVAEYLSCEEFRKQARRAS